MSRRHATRAVTATAGIALVAIGGFGLLSQPSASAAASPSALCLPPLIPCKTPTPTPTATASTTTTSPNPTMSEPTSNASLTIGPTTTISVDGGTAAPAVAQPTADTLKPGPNLTLSGLVIRKSHGKLDVIATVANTGTVPLSKVGLNVSASGERTQKYVLALNAGQHIRFHTRWKFKSHPVRKKVTVVVDPGHLFAETSESDNTLRGSKRLR